MIFPYLYHMLHVRGTEDMRRKGLIVTCIGLILIMGLLGPSHAADWKPTKPITVIVPWPAGGATDLTVRILASEMEKVLGQRLSVVNTPGASGAIGMQNAYDAPKDGYTWTGNADVSVVNYPVLDLMKVTHRDWNQWYALMTPNIIATTMDYPVKDVAELIKVMKEKPGQVAVASAGVGFSGHLALEIFKSVTGISPRHVPYAGGNPAARLSHAEIQLPSSAPRPRRHPGGHGGREFPPGLDPDRRRSDAVLHTAHLAHPAWDHSDHDLGPIGLVSSGSHGRDGLDEG